MITSVSNPKIKNVIKLKENSKERRKQKSFIIEGIRMFREAPKDTIKEIYFTQEACEKFPEVRTFVQKNYDNKAFQVDNTVFKHISDTVTPQGVLAVVSVKDFSLSELIKKQPFLLILEKLQDPGNMGTIIRTAEGAGVSGIIISRDSADIYNPKTVRSTMGSIFRVPVYISENLLDDIKKLKKSGIKIYAAHLDGKSFYEKDFTEPSAFIIGNEGNGLSEELSREADDKIFIPMMGKVESLNAAVSAAVISYEVLRQRKFNN